MLRKLRVLCLLLSSLSCANGRAEDSFLRKDDVIVCVGDSITAAGIYAAMLQEALSALYPQAGIRVLNEGRGGDDAEGGASRLASQLKQEQVSIATFMFGVNDTRWSPTDPDGKAKAFITGLKKATDIASARGTPLLFLRETHFSHGKGPAADAYEVKVTAMLDHLQTAQARFAAEAAVPLVDVRGAYERALARAWDKDPAYEFTPDIIHPTSPGHAAISCEVLKAFGAGLPLSVADRPRGGLHLENSADFVIALADSHGTVKPDGRIQIEVELLNRSTQPDEGSLVVALGGQRLRTPVSCPPGEKVKCALEFPAEALKERWGAGPVYMVFLGKQRFAAEGGFLFYSRVRPAGRAALTFAATDFSPLMAEGNLKRDCPVTDVSVRREGDSLVADFTWGDRTAVTAQTGFKDRYGKVYTTALNLDSREGQACDAVEFIFDLRPGATIGRWTSNIDSNPSGVRRLGVYRETREGKTVAALQASPDVPAEAASLTALGEDRFSLKLRAKAGGPFVGFSMRVTDNTVARYASTQPFVLTKRDGAGPEPMSYIALGTDAELLFFRFGY